MTGNSITISFKAPQSVVDRMPCAGNGRSKFIIQALNEKISRQHRIEWKPTGPRAKKFAALLAKGKSERLPLLNEMEFKRELESRRGRVF